MPIMEQSKTCFVYEQTPQLWPWPSGPISWFGQQRMWRLPLHIYTES